MAFNPKSLYLRTFLAGQKTDTVIMFTQSLLFPLFCLLPIVVIGKSQPDKPIAKQENDTIFFPNQKAKGKNKQSATLLLDLINLSDLTLCFAFMVDGLVDEPSHPDSRTF